ncbi:hypothetical protein [Marinomonas sp. THO17]|uniref:hypothetical protein n=1 Tax=Marinomonas sp. THO17 TaxID=3149048 RepID=UPI00336BC95F
MSDSNVDLNDADLGKHLLSEVANSPITLISGVSSLLMGVSSAVFYSSEVFLWLAGLTGFSVATLGSYLLKRTVFGRHKEMIRIIEKHRVEAIAKRKDMMTTVTQKLAELNHKKGTQQFSQLERKFSTFSDVLNMQFDKDELTHKRYLTIAEQLYFGAMDNLLTVATLRMSMNAINVKDLEASLSQDTNMPEEAKQALTSRIDIYRNASEQETQILTCNEQVMTKLDELTSKLSGIQTREGLSTLKLDSAIREIKHLIARVDDYDISQ